ncbi:hypothetical protein [Chryseobacterium sp. G0201]|uniref:hypothetical protein n=1 Tax=Chryseobacterium sp. G0201 TaxID=2487065 RepID=UPI000F4F3E86|nr:hypothetical protein [Chryseobacterium sp. G0201]AZA52262.1 hypothetical protein EG348_04210 [Chryseobacterium sp. G0201]
MMNKITRIEEISDMLDFGTDLVKFHIFFKKNDGNEVSVPFIVYLWDIIKFLENSEPDAAAYVNKVSKSIRSYGMKDGKILKILHGEEFPLHSFVEKYFQNLPVDKIHKHIEWSEKIINPSYIEDFREFERQFQPDLANSNSRRILFIEALDEVVQKEVNKFYPEFFEVRNNDLYAKYDEILMEKVGELGSELDNFFFKNSKK